MLRLCRSIPAGIRAASRPAVLAPLFGTAVARDHRTMPRSPCTSRRLPRTGEVPARPGRRSTSPVRQFQTRGQVGVRYYAYLIVANVGAVAWNDPGVGGISCGIEYDSAQGSGVDVFGWYLCADLEFTSRGDNGEWPAAGGGNRMTWVMTLNCQQHAHRRLRVGRGPRHRGGLLRVRVRRGSPLRPAQLEPRHPGARDRRLHGKNELPAVGPPRRHSVHAGGRHGWIQPVHGGGYSLRRIRLRPPPPPPASSASPSTTSTPTSGGSHRAPARESGGRAARGLRERSQRPRGRGHAGSGQLRRQCPLLRLCPGDSRQPDRSHRPERRPARHRLHREPPPHRGSQDLRLVPLRRHRVRGRQLARLRHRQHDRLGQGQLRARTRSPSPATSTSAPTPLRPCPSSDGPPPGS